MDLDIHGVNNISKFSLSSFSLTYQLFLINLLITIFGFTFFLIFNFYLINNNKFINQNYEEALLDLQNITNYLANNSIARIPLFDDSCKNLKKDDCPIDKLVKNELELSDPELEPTSAQKFIIQTYLNEIYEIKIYNDNWIKLIDTRNLYSLESVSEIEFLENINENKNYYQDYEDFYQYHFYEFSKKIISKKFIETAEKRKSDINIVSETIRKKEIINKIYFDKDNELYKIFTAPITSNGVVFGVVILDYPLISKNQSLGSVSFNLFNFFILFVIVMVALSFFFSRSIVRPIKKLSFLTLLETQKLKQRTKLIYPQRKDEIGILSKEIQKLSNNLKSQIDQLEKFAADVSHELKNPITSIQSIIELLQNKKIKEEDKRNLIFDLDKDLKRMNRLISDISNFTRIKAEIEIENFEYLNIKKFLDEVKEHYHNNKENINIIINPSENLYFVLVNKKKLFQVFFNLIDNSLSLAPNRSKILLKFSSIDNKLLQIKIYDQGKKISLKDKEKIFERFYTDRDINRDKHSGLGLSIAREIITSFKGSLQLTESDNLNYTGSCFIINLPLKEH
tara:strand:+ start:275 stop:1975 length:1701 start_codon:yes stop_codon:yes gene_type:complete